MTVRELIERCARGEKKAWDTFVEKYSRFVYHVIHKTIRARNIPYTTEDAEDIYENVFRALVDDDRRLMKSFGEPYNVTAWLGVITRRITNRYMSDRKIQPKSIDSSADEVTIKENLPADCDEPLQTLEKEEVRDLLNELVNDLPEREKLIIGLYYYEGVAHRDIAKVLDVSVNTVGKALFRARERLREKLKRRLAE